MKRIYRIAALALTAALTIAATKPASNWLNTVTVTSNGGHVLGNPEAEVKLTEYVSYTCSHCGDFHKESDAAIKLAYVQPGKVSVEIQHLIRDPVDLTVAMLSNCGKTSGFFQRHNDFMTGQDKWLAKIGSINEAQQARWYHGSLASRLQAVARDFGFYQTMEKRGYTVSRVNRCLADEAMVQRITQQTMQAFELGVKATPAFAINGTVLAGTHDWDGLSTQLAARF
jgi:protein-disulfide isomerase